MPVATPHHHPILPPMSINGVEKETPRRKAGHQISQGACHRFRSRSRKTIVHRDTESVPEHIAMESWQTVVASLSSVA
jgi:hypothetical protein